MKICWKIKINHYQLLLDKLDQWRVVWENSNGAALVNLEKSLQAPGVPPRGLKFGDGKWEDDKSLSVRGIFV